VYCFACKIFARADNNWSKGTFVNSGFNKWRKAEKTSETPCQQRTCYMYDNVDTPKSYGCKTKFCGATNGII